VGGLCRERTAHSRRQTSAQPFHRIRWRAKVDLNPVLTHHELFIHYGSPMISAANTVLVPTRVSKSRVPRCGVLGD
jgi:hypothetical protein